MPIRIPDSLPATGVLDRPTWAYLVQLYQALVTRG